MSALDDAEIEDFKRLLVVLDGAMANFPSGTHVSVATVSDKHVSAKTHIAPYRLADIIRRELKDASDAG